MHHQTYTELVSVREELTKLLADLRECNPNKHPIQSKSHLRWVNTVEALEKRTRKALAPSAERYEPKPVEKVEAKPSKKSKDEA